MARPKSETPKDARIDLRIEAAEKELFERAAAQDSRPLSNWIRSRLLKAARAELGTAKPKRR
jgi:uncharacterized protein (DUF1778 family)